MNADHLHKKVQDKTGFWGAQGAGCIIASARTKRILLPFRNAEVNEPHTWGTWGGAIDPGEDPAEAVRREIQEEAGTALSVSLTPLMVFRKGSFAYHNFLAITDNEFRPLLNWETEASRWFKFGEWPSPLHFGLAGLLQDGPSMEKVKAALRI